MKKYEKIMEQIRLTDEMRERIRSNIQNANLATPPAKKTVRFPYKRYLPLAASFVLLIVGAVLLTRLSPSQEPMLALPPAVSQASSAPQTSASPPPSAASQVSSQPPPVSGPQTSAAASQPPAGSQTSLPSQPSGVSQSSAPPSQPPASSQPTQVSQPPVADPPPNLFQPAPNEIGNEIVPVGSAQALQEKVGFAPPSLSHLPFEVEDVSYTAYGSDLAQVTYQGQGQSADLRKSLGKEDNSGVYRTYRTVETLKLNDADVTLSGFSSDELVMAVWHKDGVSYSLVLSDGIPLADWETVLLSLQ